MNVSSYSLQIRSFCSCFFQVIAYPCIFKSLLPALAMTFGRITITSKLKTIQDLFWYSCSHQVNFPQRAWVLSRMKQNIFSCAGCQIIVNSEDLHLSSHVIWQQLSSLLVSRPVNGVRIAQTRPGSTTSARQTTEVTKPTFSTRVCVWPCKSPCEKRSTRQENGSSIKFCQLLVVTGEYAMDLKRKSLQKWQFSLTMMKSNTKTS